MFKITEKRFPLLTIFLGAYWSQFYEEKYENIEQALADYHSLFRQKEESAFIQELAPIATDPAMVAFMNRPDSMDHLARLSGGAYVSGDDIRFIHDYLVKNRRFPTKR